MFAASIAKMPQKARDLIGSHSIIFFFSFGYRELKVEKQYRVKVFDRFINA